MAGQLLRTPLRLRPPSVLFYPQVANYRGRAEIGKREVVGYGHNGAYIYADDLHLPFPAIRFREVTPDVQHIKDKELGDWRKLTIDEKKILYRLSFCQTYAEMNAPSGDWKYILGGSLWCIAAGIMSFMTLKYFIQTPLPDSFLLENKQEELRRMIALRVDPIDGLSSNWDYEKGRWKD